MNNYKRGYLPPKKIIEECIENGLQKIIFPDGGAGVTRDMTLGSIWHSAYWREDVIVVEMSQDGKTLFVESLSNQNNSY